MPYPVSASRGHRTPDVVAGGGGGSPPSGSIIWLKSDTGTFQDNPPTVPATANNDPVGYWADQSGNAAHFTQSTGLLRPLVITNVINGKPVIRADGSTQYMTGPAGITLKPFTAAFVLRQRSAGAVNTVLGNDSGSSQMLYRVYGSAADKPEIVQSLTASIATATTALTVNTAYIVGVTYSSGGVYAFYRNGSADGTGTNNKTINSSQYLLFWDFGNFGAVDLAEMLVYTSVLSAGDLTTLFDYLNTRYAIY